MAKETNCLQTTKKKDTSWVEGLKEVISWNKYFLENFVEIAGSLLIYYVIEITVNIGCLKIKCKIYSALCEDQIYAHKRISAHSH